MAPGRLLERSVRARANDESEDEEEQFLSEDKVPADEWAASEPGQSPVRGPDNDHGESGSGPESEDAESGTDSSSVEPPTTHLKDISFGALAKAQETYVPNPRKRKHVDSTRNPVARASPQEQPTKETRATTNNTERPKPSRSSKHAPTIQSSRHAVSRHREIFEPSPSLKSRDPRFDPTILSSSTNTNTATEKANKNYSFLSAYQADEILELKTQINEAQHHDRHSERAEALKRQLMSLESKIRAADAKQRENEILKRHKEKEKEAIRSGQKAKPYFLKKSDVKKEASAEKFNSMGKKARDKTSERKRKRVTGKESKGMPRVRSEAGVSAS